MANWLNNYMGPGGGLGLNSYKRALDDGYSPQQIASAVGGTGLSVGWRLANTVNDINQASAARAQAASEAASYQNTINSYQSQLNDYSNQIKTLGSQYQEALTRQGELQKQSSEWESKFQDKSAEYETARAEADRYRDEAVGRQLQAVRSGSTTTGSQASVGSGFGSLTGGGQRFQSSKEESEISKQAREEGGLTDSVLANKGPVVQQIVAPRRQSPSAGQSSGSLASGRTASGAGYYASRFR